MSTKEVKVKSHTRKTKSGKSVIVRAHTAKHKCSDKDCGSGEELLKKKRQLSPDEGMNSEKVQNYMESHDISADDVAEYIRKVGCTQEDNGRWRLKKSRATYSYFHLVKKAGALKRKHIKESAWKEKTGKVNPRDLLHPQLPDTLRSEQAYVLAVRSKDPSLKKAVRNFRRDMAQKYGPNWHSYVANPYKKQSWE